MNEPRELPPAGLAAIRERDAETRQYGNNVTRTALDRRALLTHIDALAEREEARDRVIAAAREAVVYASTALRRGELADLDDAIYALDRKETVG